MKEYKGLNSKEAEELLNKNGKNEIKRTKKISPLKIFISQFFSPLIVLLMVAALISGMIGYLPGQEPDFVDSFLIIIIVIVSGIFGFIQEYKAEKSIEALQEISSPKTQVMRDGEAKEIFVSDLVVGDIILIESGNIVPADAKILEAFNLKVDESILTGESESQEKKKNDEVYMSTSIYVGNAKAEVIRTGMQTKIGEIARGLEDIEEEKTTFELEIEEFGKKIFILTLVIAFAVFLGNLFKYDLYTSLLMAISLAVAAIPEGLPAVVALSLALGAKIMYKQKALIRRLSVVESIGAIDIICTDKTGTITKNEMTVTNIYINNRSIQLGNDDPSEDIKKEIEPLIICGVLCNNAIGQGHPDAERTFLGEQTEIGLLKGGERLGINQEKLKEEFSRIDEVPFSSERKMMSVLVAKKKGKLDKHLVYSKGAPEILLEKCNRILIDGKVKRISDKDREAILKHNENLASNALRVLGFAYKETDKIGDKEKLEEKLIWIGLQAMIDPPHPEIEGVVSECATAGIRIIMITGDNPVTAKAIASLVGIETEEVLLGKDIDRLSDSELRKKLKKGVNIFARTTPTHKMRILKVLEKKYRVAMTGDGVNDSLALKQANVGIAMGQKGTEVAKEASDIILLDDNFSTIVAAVKQGRRIFDNIRKFINYLLVSNFAEVAVLFLATFIFTLSEPILMPAQILWINLLTDGLPALALGVDPANRNIMKYKPRPKNEALINKKLWWLIGAMGVKKTIILLITFLIVLSSGENLARTTLFTGFILYEFIRIASIRSQEKLSWISNPWLLFALFFSLGLQLLIIYSPLRVFFGIEELGIHQWMVLGAGMAIGYVLAIIITKIINRIFKDESAVY